MSDYKFKSFSEIDTVEEPSEEATVVGIENGKPIQMPMKSVKAGGGEPIIINNDTYSASDPAFGDKVKEGLLNGVSVWIYYPIIKTYSAIMGFTLSPLTGSNYILDLIPSMKPLFSGSSMYGVGVNTDTDTYFVPVKVSTNEV